MQESKTLTEDSEKTQVKHLFDFTEDSADPPVSKVT